MELAQRADQQDAQRVADAIWFRRHRFAPCRRIQEGAERLRARKWRDGVRLLVVGARDYSPRRPPSTLYRAARRPLAS